MLYLVVVVWDKNLLFATPDSAMHHWWWWQHWWIKGWVDSARGFRKPAGSRNNSTPLLFPDDDNDDEDDIDNDEDDNNDDDDDDDNWLWLALWNPVIGWLAALERRGLQAMVTIAMIMLIIVIVIGAEIVVLIVIIVLRLGCATFPPPVIESSQSGSCAPTTRWEDHSHCHHWGDHYCHHTIVDKPTQTKGNGKSLCPWYPSKKEETCGGNTQAKDYKAGPRLFRFPKKLSVTFCLSRTMSLIIV